MIKFILFIFFLFYSFNSYGYEKIHVAVASNFIEPLNLIKKEFLKNNKTSFKISTGSTAKLFAQILNKAPIDIFLSADRLTIQKIPDNKKIKVRILGQLLEQHLQEPLLSRDIDFLHGQKSLA